jgi:hypothetical protein
MREASTLERSLDLRAPVDAGNSALDRAISRTARTSAAGKFLRLASRFSENEIAKGELRREKPTEAWRRCGSYTQEGRIASSGRDRRSLAPDARFLSSQNASRFWRSTKATLCPGLWLPRAIGSPWDRCSRKSPRSGCPRAIASWSMITANHSTYCLKVTPGAVFAFHPVALQGRDLLIFVG